ncbi:MAG: metal-dependent transcriptional regulator [Chloroflexi bacterium]|nr:metal-dependent transcriptional regulator [Chloroflexota bacterium]
MRDKLTQAIEDYLKAIFELTRNEGRASTNQLAEYLEVSPASITGMIQKLATTDPPLVQYLKHHGVTLTAQGEKVALEIVRHHRLLEMYLHQTLGYPWDEVHEEADRLEHVISEQFEEKIAVALGDPRHDPHGDPIPRKDLSMPNAPETRLFELRPKQLATIMRVRDTDPNLLRYLSSLGVTPGATVKVVGFSEFDSNLHLIVGEGGETIVLGPQITEQIFVNQIS